MPKWSTVTGNKNTTEMIYTTTTISNDNNNNSLIFNSETTTIYDDDITYYHTPVTDDDTSTTIATNGTINYDDDDDTSVIIETTTNILLVTNTNDNNNANLTNTSDKFTSFIDDDDDNVTYYQSVASTVIRDINSTTNGIIDYNYDDDEEEDTTTNILVTNTNDNGTDNSESLTITKDNCTYDKKLKKYPQETHIHFNPDYQKSYSQYINQLNPFKECLIMYYKAKREQLPSITCSNQDMSYSLPSYQDYCLEKTLWGYNETTPCFIFTYDNLLIVTSFTDMRRYKSLNITCKLSHNNISTNTVFFNVTIDNEICCYS